MKERVVDGKGDCEWNAGVLDGRNGLLWKEKVVGESKSCR